MSHGNPRPIKQALAQPVFQRRLTLGVMPGRVLGHVHDKIHSGFLGGIRKPRGSLKQSGTNRIDQIGTLHALECRAHTLKVEQVISIPKIQSILRA
jgi:hypothetical protein